MAEWRQAGTEPLGSKGVVKEPSNGWLVGGKILFMIITLVLAYCSIHLLYSLVSCSLPGNRLTPDQRGGGSVKRYCEYGVLKAHKIMSLILIGS